MKVKTGEKYTMTLPLGTQVEITIPGESTGIHYIGDYLDGCILRSLTSINGRQFNLNNTILQDDMNPVEYLALRHMVERLLTPNNEQLEHMYRSLKLVEEVHIHALN